MDRLLLFIILFPTFTTFLSYFIGQKREYLRNVINIITTLVNFLVILYLYPSIRTGSLSYNISYIMGTGLNLKLDAFRYVFVLITSFIWFIINIYSSQYLFNYIHRNRYHFFFMVTYISTLGIFLSENIINLFTFFEIMSFSSYPLIIHDEDEEAHEAGTTYMALAVAGGLILLMGIFIMYSYTQLLNITQLSQVVPKLGNIKYIISILFLIGFGIKAGLVPLHIWLPKAHPAAPTPASAILSGVLVKTGIFGILITVIFIMDYDLYLSLFFFFAGFVNMFTGGILALYPTNIKKTLAYSTMSQMGYLFLGIGLMGIMKDQGYLAVYGTMFHVLNHAVFKVMLFMGVGIIFMITKELNINKLYGFGRFKPILKITFFIGFCAIIGMPGFNGYLSKTLIHHALSEYLESFNLGIRFLFEVLFVLASSITTAYLLKLYISLFVEDNSRYYASYRKYINKRALFPMVISSFIIIYIGVNPNIFNYYFFDIFNVFNIDANLIHHIDFYTFRNVFSSFITIGLGILIYLKYVLKKLRVENQGHLDYIDKSKTWISLDKDVYTPVARHLFLASTLILRFFDNLLLRTGQIISFMIKYVTNVEFEKYPNPLENMSSISEKIYANIKSKKSKGSYKNISPFKKESKDNKKLTLKKKITTLKEKSIDEIKEKEKITSLKKDFDHTKHKLNSITYSIYLVGIVIVLVLLSLIIFKT